MSKTYLTDVNNTDKADRFFYDSGRLVFMSSSQLRVYLTANSTLLSMPVNIRFSNSSIYLTDCKLHNDKLIYSVNSSVYIFSVRSSCFTVNFTNPTFLIQGIEQVSPFYLVLLTNTGLILQLDIQIMQIVSSLSILITSQYNQYQYIAFTSQKIFVF